MSTDLKSRNTTSKSEAFLQRKFAELCARIRRIDLAACLLTLPLTILGYAFLMGLFDRLIVSNESWIPLFRWAAYAVFLGAVLFLSVRSVRCALRRINPYYVAHQLERTLPDAKNSLINWLDLHDEELPAAFRKNLSMNAAEQLQESDLDQPLPTRRNRLLLGALAPPTLGLLILLLLGPGALASSMLHAFLPFLDTDQLRTRITLEQPAGGNFEVSPNQAVTFSAKIEGRIPARDRPDAPRLLYRYQPNEDFIAQPLAANGDGRFTTQLLSTQLRTGFSYQIAAGDSATDEYQVRVRARAHVKKFEIAYHYRPYRKLAKTMAAFPNQHAQVPFIHGQRGTEVDLVVRASRPVQKANVEIVTGAIKKDLPTRLSEDGLAFSCHLKLEQSASFRVTFTSVDGEENIDRERYHIEVVDDEAPHVVLTQPGKDVSLPANGTLEIAGRASDDFGLKNLTLRLHLPQYPEIKLEPKVYRAGQPFQRSDGSYPDVIEYQDFIAIDELKEKATIRLLRVGDVLEYWLEATDNADYPSAAGNVGKSLVYKVTLTPEIKDAKKQQAQRKRAQDAKAQHDKKQDEQLAKENKNSKENQGETGGEGPEDQANKLQNDKNDKDTKDKIEKEMKKEQGGGGQESSKNQGANKPGPSDASEGPQPRNKDQKPMGSDDAGSNKEQGGEPGPSGEARDGGGEDKQEAASKGDSKEGPKETSEPAKDGRPMDKAEPAGGAKDGGPMGANAPPMGEPKDSALDAPMPKAKGDDAGPMNGQGNAQGNAKAEPKEDQPKKEGAPNLDDVAKLMEKLAHGDAEAKKAAADKLADIGKKADDEPLRELAKEILDKNGRDQGTGKEKKKGPNLYGSLGKSAGISDDIKAAAANREFTRRIGQMQLDDWKKRLTPELLKKAGVSEADWQRYVKNQQAYDALVRQLNAKQTMAAVREARNPRPAVGTGPRVIESPATSNDSLESGRYQPPPELLDAQRRFSKKQP